jgi:bifunctional N-acetylglucosamine-1-phosphate-uridyltransferase/glucosamine-1-phosphate-acetyltransferase GlmU-like protein
MMTIVFTTTRLVRLVHLPQGQKCNQEYFINDVLEGLREESDHVAGYRVTKPTEIHMDNSRVHNSLETTDKMRKMKMERLAHPSYSRDLSGCDFWLFGLATIALQH